jgi:aspartate racemase
VASRTFCSRAFNELGEYQHPDVTLDCIAFGAAMPAWDAGDHDTVREILAVSASRLAAAGAAFFACPDNTAHMALERPGPPLAIPGLHVAEVVAHRADRDGRHRVGVLGTRFTMDGPLYPGALGRRGLKAAAPVPDDRELVDRIIFDELVHGVFTDASRDAYAEVIARLRDDHGCDAVALVCTEIPLLMAPKDSPLPTLDSTTLLAEAALDVAVGRAPLPAWRGGPIDGR